MTDRSFANRRIEQLHRVTVDVDGRKALLNLIDRLNAALAVPENQPGYLPPGELGPYSAEFAQLAISLGIDPRPIALRAMHLFGVDAFLSQSGVAQLPRVVTARARRSWGGKAAQRAKHLQDRWHLIEPTTESLAGLRVTRVRCWSDDDLDPGDEGKVWHEVDRRSVAVRDEADLLEAIALAEHFDEGRMHLWNDRTFATKFAKLKEIRKHSLDHHNRRHFLVWSATGPTSPTYDVELRVVPAIDERTLLPAGPALPLVLDGCELREIAPLIPECPVVEITATRKEDVAAGFMSRGRGKGASHSAATLVADAVFALTEVDEPSAKRRLYLRVADLTDRDLDWIWPSVLARRRFEGEARYIGSRASQSVPSGVMGEVVAREDAVTAWIRELAARNAKFTVESVRRIRDEHRKRYPTMLACPKCETWWAHGCDACRKRAAGCCLTLGVCSKCGGQLTSSRFDLSPLQVRDLLHRRRDVIRHSEPRPQRTQSIDNT